MGEWGLKHLRVQYGEQFKMKRAYATHVTTGKTKRYQLNNSFTTILFQKEKILTRKSLVSGGGVGPTKNTVARIPFPQIWISLRVGVDGSNSPSLQFVLQSPKVSLISGNRQRKYSKEVWDLKYLVKPYGK